MTDIVICMLNSQYIHSGLAPWCLFAGIKEYCTKDISAKVIESNINADMGRIADEIVSEKPAVIGFCCYIWNINKVLSLAKEIKKRLPGCTVILGGPEVSYNARDVLKSNSFVDFILSGEGEKSFAMLCDAVASGKSVNDLTDIPGICMRDGDGYYISEPCVSDGQPVSPYTDEYFKALRGRISYIESSRGCPFSCAFCLSGRCGSVRFFDIEETKKNILALANSGSKTIKFVDRTFNANRKRALKIWSFIKNEYGKGIPEDVCVHFEIGGDLPDTESLDVLASMPSGSIQLEIGIQSFNEKTLEAINRKTDLEKLYTNIKKLVSFGNMHIHTDLIAGLPYEDLESFRFSFNRAFSLGSNMLQLGFLKLLHGAPMRVRHDIFPCKFSKDAPYEVISTPWLTEDDIAKLKLVDLANDKISNSARFRYSLKYILESVHLSPFDIFLQFGEYIKERAKHPIPLFELARLYCEFFIRFPGIDRDRLYDMMICDFFSHSRYGKLPTFLKREDPRTKKVLELLAADPSTRKKDNAVRAAAVFRSEQMAVYCDSGVSREDDVQYKEHGHYILHFKSISDITDK